MIGTEVDGVGETDQCRVSHQIPDASVQVGRCMVEVFPIPDSDEIRELRRIVQAAIPARETAAWSESGGQVTVLSVRNRLELLIDIARAPRHAKSLVSLVAGRLSASDKRRVAQADHTVRGIDLQAQRSSRAPGAILRSSPGPEFGSARYTRAVRQRQHVAVAAV